MQFNFSDTLEKAERDYGLGSGSAFKPKEGDNYIRLLSGFEPHSSEYQGKPTFKFVGWILDRRDNSLSGPELPVVCSPRRYRKRVGNGADGQGH
jgi:hypothetical protein